MLLLTSPFTPLLWMGEEWAASTRWPFFTSHSEPELAEATGKGRLEEFATHGWDVTMVLDPQDPGAYQTAILDWSEPARHGHAEILSLYRELIALRAAEADLRDADLTRVSVDFDEVARWLVVHRNGFRVAANLAHDAQLLPLVFTEIVLSTGPVESVKGGLLMSGQSAAIVRVK